MAKPAFPMEVRDGHIYAKVPMSYIVKDVNPNGDDFMAALRRMYDENGKLRKLVALMPKCWGNECMDCPMGIETTARGVFGCKAEDMLREMGFEVD